MTPEAARVFIADFSSPDNECAGRAEQIAGQFPHTVTIVKRQRLIGSMFSDLADEVHRRGDGAPCQQDICLLIQGVHRIKSLREDEEDEDGRNAVELLSMILRDGPELGIYVIAWADTWTSMTRGLGRKRCGDFGLRIGGIMSTEESLNCFDSPVASRFSKTHRAVFLNEDQPGQLVTFRPYSMPSATWLQSIGEQMRARMTAAS